jgi:hypothetical protein
MRLWLAVHLLTIHISACSTQGSASRDPASPTPVAEPERGPGSASPPPAAPGKEGAGGLPQGRGVPLRPDQAPLVHIREVLKADSLLGRRVRVAGRCTASGEGGKAGSWTLAEDGATVEVRGLVPFSCDDRKGEELTIFAQIEPKSSGSRERLLLRLPD